MHSGPQRAVARPDVCDDSKRADNWIAERMMVMRRKPMSHGKSQRVFRKGASRVQSVNFAGMPMRGGIRM